MRRDLKKALKMILVILGLIILFVIADVIISYKCLTVTDYKIQSAKMKEDMKIILISDLHDGKFGGNNQRLIQKIKEQHPDLILMDGDMINEESKDPSVATNLVKELTKSVPVYYSLGNHELGYLKRKTSDLTKQLKKSGAIVLDKEWQDIRIKNNDLRIGGLYDYAFELEGKLSKKDKRYRTRKFLTSFEDTKNFKIMMAHRPDSFIFNQAADTWKIDLVASGHAHGGQVIIPGKGGLYGADHGWFPKYVDGIHHFKTVKNMIITRGLGSDKEKLPRFNNTPEIVVINLKK